MRVVHHDQSKRGGEAIVNKLLYFTESLGLTARHTQAEELMRKIEKEEEQLAYDDPDKKIYHLCIVNLVIG